jgi:hypothetical protein
VDPRDRRLLVWIVVCTTVLAAVVALALLVTVLELILIHV